MTTLRLPWPPSVNNLYWTIRGKRVLTKQGREYHQAAAAICHANHLHTITGSVSLRIDVHPPNNLRRDISNLIKVIEDGLTEGGAWLDDCQVVDLRITKRENREGGQVVVEIQTP